MSGKTFVVSSILFFFPNEHSGCGGVQAHWPVRIGRDLTPLFEGFCDKRRSVKFAEMQFNRALSAAGMSLNVRNPQEFIDLLSSMPLESEPAHHGQPQQHSALSNLSNVLSSSGVSRHQGPHASGSRLTSQNSGMFVSGAVEGEMQRLALHEMAVTKVAAGKECSAALTATGEVWMFGFSHDRLFSNGNAVQTDGRPIEGRPARLIAENGGAIDIVIGLHYCAVLARNGAVVLWGKVAPEGVLVNWSAATPSRRSASSIQDSMMGGHAGRAASLPAMTHIAAGRAQLVMSNGEGVWHMRVIQDSWDRTADTIQRMNFDVRVYPLSFCLMLLCCDNETEARFVCDTIFKLNELMFFC